MIPFPQEEHYNNICPRCGLKFDIQSQLMRHLKMACKAPMYRHRKEDEQKEPTDTEKHLNRLKNRIDPIQHTL